MTDEIERLIAEYNAAEQVQRARLVQLYDLIDARKGYRRVAFTGFTWSNCWGWPLRGDAMQKFIDPLVGEISAFELGSP